MEITFDTIISLLGLFIGGGGGAFFTWRYMRRKAKAEAQTEEVNMAKAVQDAYQQMLADKESDLEDRKKVIAELREERDHYKNDRNELRDRVDKMENTVLELKREVARNGRIVENMRPFICYDTKCKKRVRVPVSECAAADIEPIDSQDL